MKRILSGLRYAGVVLFAVLFTWCIHELGHWLAYKSLGYDAVMTLNTVSLKQGTYQKDWHWILTSAVGPAITILQALAVYLWLSLKGWHSNLYPFLVLTLYMRSLAGFMNVIGLNDEGRISHYLGIGDFTLSVLVSALLAVLVYKISKKYEPGWKYQLTTLMLIMLFSSILILGDQVWDIVLLPS